MTRRKAAVKALIIIIALCFNTAVFAASDGTTGAAFLKINPGARPGAMAAYAAVSDDAYANYFNPAGLSQLKGINISAMHLSQFGDINVENISLGVPLNAENALGFSFTMLHTSDYIRTELDDLSSFQNRDIANSLSYSRKITDYASLGITFKHIHQKLYTYTAQSYAFDAGFLARIPNTKLKFGVAAYNVGPKITFIEIGDKLPFNIRAGFSYPYSRFLFAVDAVFPNDSNNKFYAGTEITLTDHFKFRTGYEFGSDFKGLNALSAGFGFNYINFNVDYAYLPREKLGDVHRFSLGYLFDARVKEPEPVRQKEKIIPVFEYKPPIEPKPPVPEEPAEDKKTLPAAPEPPVKGYEDYLSEGEQLLHSGRYAEAAKRLEKAYELNKSDINLLYNLSDAYYKLNDFKKALFYIQQVQKLIPE